MVSKKLKLLLAFVGLMQIASYAQDSTMSMSMSTTDAPWAYDSSKTANKPQYSEFVNYQTPYPPKPRGMWELTVSGGNAVIIVRLISLVKLPSRDIMVVSQVVYLHVLL